MLMNKIFDNIGLISTKVGSFLTNTHTLYPMIVLVLALILHRITRQILLFIKKRVQNSKIGLDLKIRQHILNRLKIERLSLLVYTVAFVLLRNKFLEEGFLNVGNIFATLSTLIIIYITARFLHEILDGLAIYTESKEEFRGRSYRSYIQVLILIVYIAAFVIGGGAVSGKSPWDLLSGIGAMTAVLLLIFRETILSFISSLQISSYDLVRLGDWISVPKYDADGDVIELALHTIKIQNWDKTISVIPTHEILQSGFKNWRGMTEIGGRRIKRSIFLDSHSVRFMDKELREKLGHIELLTPYFEELESSSPPNYQPENSSFLNNRYLTNLGTFRAYVLRYLKSMPDVKQDLTLLVRQLESGPTGIPLELYLFTATTVWAEYEKIQADIFDHLFAILPVFELRTFQYSQIAKIF